MIIQYVHHSAPEEMREFDTEKAWKNTAAILSGRGNRTLEEFNQLELKKFAEDQKKGYILHYNIKEE